MQNETIIDQATNLECLLPKVMRKLFTLELSHPVNELPLAQLRICTILQAGPRTMSALSEELATSVSAVTQIADRLERAGLVERFAEEEDRRMKRLRLTEQGEAMMRSRREARVRRAAEALAHLSPEERDEVLHALRMLVTAANLAAPEMPYEDPVGVRVEQ